MAKRPAKRPQQRGYAAPEWHDSTANRSIPKPPPPKPVKKLGVGLLLGGVVLAIAAGGWWFTRSPVYEAPRPQRWVETDTPDDSPVLVIVNATQSVLSVELAGDYSYQFEIPPCSDCAPTDNTELMDSYCETAPEHTATLQTGTYKAVVRLDGQLWAQADQWLFSDGWWFYECYVN